MEETKNEFFKKGFCVFKMQETQGLSVLQESLKKLMFDQFQINTSLPQFHQNSNPADLNEQRLACISWMNSEKKHKDYLVSQLTPTMQSLLGEDLVVQKNLNLMITPPQDQSSLLPLHADTWTGHSPFEIAVLVPLTPLTPKQKMYILPLPAWREKKDFTAKKNINELYDFWKDSFEYLHLNPGEVLLFWHHLPHGNWQNEDQSTHWSVNLRFKNLYTPFGQKGLGDYFVPLKLSPFTDMVLQEANQWV